MNSNNLIEDLLNSITPEESLRIENRMLMAAKIDDAIKAKDWKKKDLMEALGKKNQSEITKWLSGTQNFTIDILTDLGRVLNVNFLHLEKEICGTNEVYKVTRPIIVVSQIFKPKNYINEMFDIPTSYNAHETTLYSKN